MRYYRGLLGNEQTRQCSTSPITQATLDELLQPNAAAAVIPRLKMEELAALLLLQGLPTLVTGAKTAEALLISKPKVLAALIKLYGGFPLDELQQAVVETWLLRNTSGWFIGGNRYSVNDSRAIA